MEEAAGKVSLPRSRRARTQRTTNAQFRPLRLTTSPPPSQRLREEARLAQKARREQERIDAARDGFTTALGGFLKGVENIHPF